ncbi:MAG TPA: CHASE3 domain-containing protein [Puia sp.]|nr:CHASE3 domain-containing protein [Puia sp.]
MKKIIKKFTADRNVRVGYGTAFFLLLLSYLLTLYVNRQLLREARLVDHTNRVLTHLESLLSNVKDAETGSRGYFIMQDMRFLDPYFPSRSKVDSMHTLLKTELVDNPLQVQRLDTLKRLIDKRFEALQQNITRFQSNNFELTDSLKADGYQGKKSMDGIRSLVLRMQLHEEALLKGRETQMHGQYNALNTVVITSLVLALILAIYGFFTYTRENIARRKADQTVFEYQEELKERINELDKANKELVQMRSIEKLAATGRIARTIAHEVRNPLTNINLSVDQLRGEFEEGNEGALSLFDMITRNSNRINALITDLLNSTKFTELIYKRESVNKMLDETLELARDRLQLKKIKVIKKYSGDVCDVSVDVERIKIAFLNIIVNALEAMESDNGILTIKTATSVDGKCMVYINDNGPGIGKESLSKLFEPYFTSKPKGTGLGLTNAQNIILNHSGYIYAESELGKGTTFVISLNFA